MKKLGFVLLFSLLMTLVFAVPASAGPPIDAEGLFETIAASGFTFTDIGENHCIVEGDIVNEVTGTLQGRSSFHIRVEVAGPCGDPPNPPATTNEQLHSKGKFVGAVVIGDETYSGTFEFNYRLKTKPDGTFKSTYTIIRGTGTDDLVNLHGVLTEEDTFRVDPDIDAYTGKIHFDP